MLVSYWVFYSFKISNDFRKFQLKCISRHLDRRLQWLLMLMVRDFLRRDKGFLKDIRSKPESEFVLVKIRKLFRCGGIDAVPSRQQMILPLLP